MLLARPSRGCSIRAAWEPISISTLISIMEDAVILSSALGLAEWHSGDAWFSQQDRSHAETETDVGTIKTDNIAGSNFVTLYIS
jgi:hypothetical protein